MGILSLLSHLNERSEKGAHPVFNKDTVVKRSYLTGIAMQAFADDVLDEREREHFLSLAEAFEFSELEANHILGVAARPNEAMLEQLRKNLIHSKLKYYFVVDLQIMAQQDHCLDSVERDVIAEFGRLLAIEPEDIQFFTELADAVIAKDPDAKKRWVDSFFNRVRREHAIEVDDFSHYTGS